MLLYIVIVAPYTPTGLGFTETFCKSFTIMRIRRKTPALNDISDRIKETLCD
jgi:hypothetical protein